MLLLLIQLLSTAFLVKGAPHLSSWRTPIRTFHGEDDWRNGISIHSTVTAHRRRGVAPSIKASASLRTYQSAPFFSIPRGGAIDQLRRSGASDDADGILLQKLRNVIRSALQMTKGSSLLHNGLVSFFKTLESALGFRLLPEKRKKKNRGGRTKKQVVDNEEDCVPLTEKSSSLKEKTKSATASKKSATKLKKSRPVKKASSKPSVTTALQLKKKMKATNPNYRIQQELKAFLHDPPEHLTVATGKNIRIWIVTVEGIGIYKGETFRLRIQFPNNYPTVPPSVYFLPPIPMHEHVYTNGDICLSLLGKDWRPTMTAQSVAHSILSILASATSKSLPMDNARQAQNKPGQYQADWVYHDDNC